MDDLLPLTPARLHLLICPHRAGYQLMNTLAARLALLGPVCVLDGGNGLDVHTIARLARQQHACPEATLQRITIGRAFTCCQMSRLLSQPRPAGMPVLVMDLLATFYDENLPLPERLRLLQSGLDALRPATALLCASPLAPDQPSDLLDTLISIVDAVWRWEEAVPLDAPRLF